MGRAGFLGVLLVATLLPAVARAGEGDPDLADLVRNLREEVRELRGQVRSLENRLADTGDPAAEASALDRAIEDLLEPNVAAPGLRWLRISGQVRVQAEKQLDYDFDGHEGDTNGFVRLRTRIAFDADVSEHLRGFLTLQDSRSFGEEGGTLGDLEGVDLKEGYLDIRRVFGRPVTVRIGRHAMKYGDQRLISTLDWSHVGRAWDGVWVMYDEDDVSAHLFWTKLDERFLLDGEDEDEDFCGLYATWRPGEGTEADLYLLFRRNQDADDIAGEDGRRGHERLWTAGSRYRTRCGGVTWVAEGAWQFGKHARDDVCAWMFEAGASYPFAGVPGEPSIAASFLWASGDDDPADGRRGTFDPLYTFGHFYLGYVDVVGRRNVLSPKLSLKASPAPEWILALDVLGFWLDRVEDGLYAASGKRIRAGDPTGRAGSFAGWEIDLHVKFPIHERLKVWAGWSRFFAGEFLRDTGPHDDAYLVYLQLTLDF